MEILTKTSLFSGIKSEEIEQILKDVTARIANYQKGETIIWEGEEVTEIGIVLEGRGRSVKVDFSGKTLIISLLEAGSFIGVLLAASHARKSPVSVQATDGLTALFIPFDNILNSEGVPCRRLLIRNCFDSLAEKSMALCDRIDCLIRPTVRDKAISYLTRLMNEAGGNVFTSPLDRNAMAEYLCVDRSALSRELSRMKAEGLIDYYKNSFKLYHL